MFRKKWLFLLLIINLIYFLKADFASAIYGEGLATVHYGRSRTYDMQHMKLELSFEEL